MYASSHPSASETCPAMLLRVGYWLPLQGRLAPADSAHGILGAPSFREAAHYHGVVFEGEGIGHPGLGKARDDFQAAEEGPALSKVDGLGVSMSPRQQFVSRDGAVGPGRRDVRVVQGSLPITGALCIYSQINVPGYTPPDGLQCYGDDFRARWEGKAQAPTSETPCVPSGGVLC